MFGCIQGVVVSVYKMGDVALEKAAVVSGGARLCIITRAWLR